MKRIPKTKELYVRPTLAHLREMFFPLGWSVIEERNADYPYNTTDVYVVHERATAVMSLNSGFVENCICVDYTFMVYVIIRARAKRTRTQEVNTKMVRLHIQTYQN